MTIMYENAGIAGKIEKLFKKKKTEILEPTNSITIEELKYLKLKKNT